LQAVKRKFLIITIKINFEMIFEQNARYADNAGHGFDAPIQPILQGLAGLFGGDADLQAVFDGFMLQDIDFEGMSWKEIEDTIARLRREAEPRRARAMANQAEVERKAAKQVFAQTAALLDELEKRLLERKEMSWQNEYGHLLSDEDAVLEF
jgi:hypothetical protein